MKVKEFTDKDWSAFCGCESWYGSQQEGCEPLIGEVFFADGVRFCLVLDRTGACLLVEDDPVNATGGRCLLMPFPAQATALAFAEGIGEPKSLQDFLRLDFHEI